MLHLAARWVKPVEPAASAGEDSAKGVLRDHADAVATKALGRGVGGELQTLCLGMVHSNQSASGVRQPQPARMVQVNLFNDPRRQSVLDGEKLETPVAI